MIARLRGTVVERSPLAAVLECGGIGFSVALPLRTAERLPAIGQEAVLHTVAVYREDSQALYGFHDATERAVFALLIDKVQGVGPRLALSLLSTFTVEALREAVSHRDTAALSRCPGVGKKTAERLLVELRDKAFPGGEEETPGSLAPTGTSPETVRDAITALQTLGFKPAEAATAVARARKEAGDQAPTEELIRRALGG